MLSDQEIMRRCQQGQTDLLDLLIERHGAVLYTFCLRLCRRRADAEDLFQDCWLAVLRHCSRFDLQLPFLPWLYTICVNLQRDHFRKARRWLKALAGARSASEQASSGQISLPGAPEATLVRDEQLSCLAAALAKMDEAHRLPLLLHYYCDMPLAEIGSVLGVPAGTVKSRLARAREHLRLTFKEDGHDQRP